MLRPWRFFSRRKDPGDQLSDLYRVTGPSDVMQNSV
jgi:hypothetical protein